MTITFLKIFIFASFLTVLTYPQEKLLDDFQSLDGWTIYKSDGVSADLSIEEGYNGKALRFDYDFTKGSGYGGIQKLIPLDLPDNYKFTFYIKAVSPNNNLEFKKRARQDGG